MAFSVSTQRSTPQDSPTFWLSLIAGSLALHLVLLLMGRWYFSQVASAPQGTTQAPLDFVEIDPNALPLKQAKPIAPANTPTQTELPRSAPPPSVTETTQAPNSIATLPRQATQERSQSRSTSAPSPTVNQPNRAQRTAPPEQRSSDRTTPRRNPTAPSTPTRTTPSGTTSGSSTPGTTPGTTPGSSTSGKTTPGTTPGSPGATPSRDPSNSNTGASEEDPNASGSSGRPLTIATSIQGRVLGGLQEDDFRPEQYAKGTVSLKTAALPAIEVDFSSKLPVKTLDLRLGLSITADGQVVDVSVLDDSPTLRNNPALNDPKFKLDIKSIATNLVLNANADRSLTFNANLESKDAVAYRIMSIQIDLKQ